MIIRNEEDERRAKELDALTAAVFIRLVWSAAWLLAIVAGARWLSGGN